MGKEKETMNEEANEEAKVTGKESGKDDFMKATLSKNYKFEGQTVSKIDLSGLENLTAGDMIQIGKEMRSRGNTDASPEFTMEYSLYAAMHVTEFPLEFFLELSAKDAMKVKLRVNYFFAR